MLILVALASSASSAHAKKLFANIVWSPSPFDFGQVVPPATAKQTFTLFNVGERSSGRIAVTLSGSPAFAISKDRCTDKALRPNKSCEVIVEYEPSTTNADAGTLTATAKKASTFENVYGNGTADLTLSPGAFLETVNGTNFYDASGAFVSGFPEIFTVSNRGTGISEVLTTTAGGSDPEFAVSEESCRQHQLAPGDNCAFSLTFTLPNGCTSGTDYHAMFEVEGISPPFVTYLHLGATETCP